MAKPWLEVLNRTAVDPNFARQEIERAKAKFMDPKSTPEEKAAANRYANQVRERAGISNSDSQYGNDPRTYKGNTSNPITDMPSQYKPSVGSGVGVSGDLMEAIFGMMGGGGGVSNDQLASIKSSAAQRAEQERQAYQRQLQMYQAQQQAALGNNSYMMQQLNAQRMQNANNFMLNMFTMNNQRTQEQAALENMMKQYGVNRDTGLSQIQNGVEDAKQALENKSFQDYLQSRQSIADRGLSGSGIAADADTRLALAKQQNMAGIMRDAATQTNDLEGKYATNMDKAKYEQLGLQSKYGTNLMKLLSDMSNSNMNLSNQAFKLGQDRGSIFSQFAPQMGGVYDKMNAINADTYEQDALFKAQQAADKSNNDRLQILSTLLGKMMPYDAMTLNQQGQLGLGYDKLNSGNINDWRGDMISYLNNQWMKDYRDRALEQNGLIDYSKLAGVLPDGTPTMDARKLQQLTNYQNQMTQLKAMGLENTAMYRQLQMEYNYARLGETQMQNDRTALNNAMMRLDSEMATLSTRLQQDPNNNQIKQRLNDITNEKRQLMALYTSGNVGLDGSTAPDLGYIDYNGGRYAVQGPANPK